MERAVHDLIEEPLGRLILEGKVSRGQRLRVLGEANVLRFYKHRSLVRIKEDCDALFEGSLRH